MVYKAEDKWSNETPHLEHRADHKYYMKIGQGPTARYFYSAAEYAAYQNGLRSQVNREKQSASARNESRIIARQNVRTNSRNSSDTRNLRSTVNRAQLKENRAMQARGENRLQQNRATDRLERTQIRKEKQAATERNERTVAGKRREARKQAYVDFQRNRGKKPAPAQKKSMADNRRLANNANSTKRYEKAHPIETGIKKARKAANSAYKSAKKAYNSKQAKAVRKKVKRTAQSAYKRGSNFVKKLFGR